MRDSRVADLQLVTETSLPRALLRS